MKENRILYALGDVDEEYIDEAAPSKKRSGRTIWIRWIAAAACLCLIIGGIYAIKHPKGTTPVDPGSETTPVGPGGETGPVDPDDTTPHDGEKDPQGGDATPVNPGGETTPVAPGELPKIEVPVVDPKATGQGNGLRYFKPDDLRSGNPWNEDIQLDTLPVYSNGTFDRTGAGIPKGLSVKEMTEKLSDVAKALGLTIADSGSEDVVSGEKGDDGIVIPSGAGWVEAITDKGMLRVYADGRITVTPKNSALPEGCDLGPESTDSEQEKAMKYLVEEYADLLNYEQPEIVYQDPSIEEWYFGYIVYDGAEDIAERIINYNLHYAEFVADENGVKWINCYDKLCKAKKIGDYPLISVAEAKEKLLDGKYQTRWGILPALRGEEYIAKVDLVYRSGWMEQTLLPYYRFWVEVEEPAGEEKYHSADVKPYGFYYVPAIPDEYISNWTTWFDVK